MSIERGASLSRQSCALSFNYRVVTAIVDSTKLAITYHLIYGDSSASPAESSLTRTRIFITPDSVSVSGIFVVRVWLWLCLLLLLPLRERVFMSIHVCHYDRLAGLSVWQQHCIKPVTHVATDLVVSARSTRSHRTLSLSISLYLIPSLLLTINCYFVRFFDTYNDSTVDYYLTNRLATAKHSCDCFVFLCY